MNSKTDLFGIHSVRDIAKVAVVAALYIVLTMVLAPLSFGAIQFRLAEMFNHLAVYNKRYVVAVTLGVAIANFTSPYGIIDILWGSFSTLMALLVVRWLTAKVTNQVTKLVISTTVVTLSMFTIAGEIAWLAGGDFWPTFFGNWLTIGIGELGSLLIGAILIYILGKRIDLTK